MRTACEFESHGFRLGKERLRKSSELVRNLLGRQAAANVPLVGSIPTASACENLGVMVQQDDASIARWRSGCDSR